MSGFPLAKSEVEEYDLAYIGGLLKLDIRYDEEARAEVFNNLRNRRRASPDRKG